MTTPQDNHADGAQRIIINTQYVKDLSFENPGAPASLVSMKSQPKIDLSVDIKVQKLHEENFEVTLHITANASVETKPLFLTDLAYSGLFTIEGVGPEHIEPILLVYCPSLLFPFARRIIADATRDGGFLPLMIEPIDFATLYHHRLQQQQQETATTN